MPTVKRKQLHYGAVSTLYEEDANADKSIVDFNFQKYCK